MTRTSLKSPFSKSSTLENIVLAAFVHIIAKNCWYVVVDNPLLTINNSACVRKADNNLAFTGT